MNMTLFGNRVFVGVINLNAVLMQYDVCLYKKRKMPCAERGKQREGLVTREAEAGVI